MELQTSEEVKSNIINLKVTAEQKELLEKAASSTGLSLSDFVLSKSLEAAWENAASHNQLVLSARDWELFVSLMENPPEPNEALKSAMREYLEEYES